MNKRTIVSGFASAVLFASATTANATQCYYGARLTDDKGAELGSVENAIIHAAGPDTACRERMRTIAPTVCKFGAGNVLMYSTWIGNQGQVETKKKRSVCLAPVPADSSGPAETSAAADPEPEDSGEVAETDQGAVPAEPQGSNGGFSVPSSVTFKGSSKATKSGPSNTITFNRTK